MEISVNETHLDLSDWQEVDALPWTNWFVYGLLRKYPSDVRTVLLCVSPGGTGGKRLVSKSDLESLLLKLAAEQKADTKTKAQRSKAFREKRLTKKKREEEALA
jgi:hypothetical protein